jgi:carbamoyltransferase
MALASFGKDNYKKLFDRLIRYDTGSKMLKIDSNLLDYHGAKNGVFSNEWQSLTGLAPRQAHEIITKKHKHLAHSLQKKIESTMFKMLTSIFPDLSSKPLCAAGGLFLNSVMNGKIVENINNNFFIQPAAGDNGVSIGAALFVNAKNNNSFKKPTFTNCFLGKAHSNNEIIEALKYYSVKPRKETKIFAKTVDALIQGKIVGWFKGKMEFGPRALGNRSILADPSYHSIKDIVNRKVKHRETFRPFACSLLIDEMYKYFDYYHEDQFMLKVFKFKEKYKNNFPAICHVDNTCRIQTVSEQQNPDFYLLLKEMKRRKGYGIVLNTSMNDCGEPLVYSPKEALQLMLNTKIDVMVLGDYFIRKENFL